MSIKESIQSILKAKELTWFGKILALLVYLIGAIIISITYAIIYVPYSIFVLFRFFITGKFKIYNLYKETDWQLFEFKDGEISVKD